MSERESLFPFVRRRKPRRLCASEAARARKHIQQCDRLFDGKREDGTPATYGGGKEVAYDQLRILALELVERLT